MKTLILNGSPRKQGDTVSLLGKVTERLTGEYMQVDAYEANIQPCTDCRFCRINRGCAISDDMADVYAYLQECDNVLIASPVYFGSLTGPLLSVASRIQAVFSANMFLKQPFDLKPKKGGMVLVGGGSGTPDGAHQSAAMLLREMHAVEIFPLILSGHTDIVPAIADQEAVLAAEKLAEFFNGK